MCEKGALETPFPVDLKMSKHLQASGAAHRHSAIYCYYSIEKE